MTPYPISHGPALVMLISGPWLKGLSEALGVQLAYERPHKLRVRSSSLPPRPDGSAFTLW